MKIRKITAATAEEEQIIRRLSALNETNAPFSESKVQCANVYRGDGIVYASSPRRFKLFTETRDLLLVREAETNAYGRFLSLEPLTLAPFDRDTIDPSLLSDRELAQLNAYHARVYETLAPHLDAETRAWLRGVTAPLGK